MTVLITIIAVAIAAPVVAGIAFVAKPTLLWDLIDFCAEFRARVGRAQRAVAAWLDRHLISEWRDWWRLWSVQIPIFAMVVPWLVFALDVFVQLPPMLTDDFLPYNTRLILSLLSAAIIVARLWNQKAWGDGDAEGG